MKILLPTGFWFHKTYHSFAKRIKEIYPEARFGVFGSKQSLSYLRKVCDNDNDIEYEIFEIVGRSRDEGLFKEDIDYDELKKFEEGLPHKSLWRVIASDRGLGAAFLHGAVGYDNKDKSDYKYILNTFNNAIIQIREIFDRYSPDIYIQAIAMGSIEGLIIEKICQERKVLYLVPESLRVKNLCAFANDLQISFTHIDVFTRKLIEGVITMDLSPAEKLYKEIMSELKSSDYFDSKNARLSKIEFPNILHRIKYLFINITYKIMKIILSDLRTWRNEKIENYGAKSFSFSILFFKIRRQVLSGIQRLRLLSPKFGTILSPSQKYVYYPLQGNPEYSSNILGTMWMNQANLIETLAKSIPSDWVVYVKEHPGTLYDRIRPWCFFDRLKEIPNVFVAPVYMNTHEIICNSEMVAVVSGTSGWEAIQRSKPVIEFRDNLWSVLGLSKKCTDIEKLSNEIYNEVKRIKEISPQERKRRIVCLFAAMLKYGFWVTNPKQLFFVELGNDEEYEVSGRELADGMIKHLEYLHKEKGYKLC